MKARVIREWKMNGITHKVGEIMNIPLHSPGGLPMISDRDAFLLDNGFIEEIQESTRWRPEKFQTYYYVGGDGRVYDDGWVNYSAVDNGRFDIGNCFQTKEETERVVEYLKALAIVRGDATTKFTKGKNNWSVSYGTLSNRLFVENHISAVDYGIFGLPYFATEEDAQRSIELHRNEWLTIFGVKEEE